MDKRQWTSGNSLQLLECGEAFFPAALDAMRAAEHEIILETFILFDDEVGQELQGVLVDAASRGVQVDITLDGYGSGALDAAFTRTLTEAGVRLHVYGPMPRMLGNQPNMIHRLHRKLLVVDQQIAFVGGINWSRFHLRKTGEESKHDYAVQVQGPAVEAIHQFCKQAIGQPMRRRRMRGLWRRGLPDNWRNPGTDAQALFVARDNHHRKRAIETLYRLGLRRAERDITLFNAYFFPGFGFLRDMRRAARRGVKVRLILQGEPDKAYVKFAASTLYDRLLRDGVEIWEYMARPVHAKVAVMDDAWATVGSSNLDPFSLSLNLEANLFVRDETFAGELRERIERLLEEDGRQVTREDVKRRSIFWHAVRSIGFHIIRLFPQIASMIPARHDRMVTLEKQSSPTQGKLGAQALRAKINGDQPDN